MQVVRIHDPARRPASWSEIIRPGQFVAFATPSDGNCVLFDSLDEARAYSEGVVGASPLLQFDIFDALGRAQPPLLTVVHPSRAAQLDQHPRAMHKRRVIGWVLIVAGTVLIGWTYWKLADIEAIFPGVIGVNLLLAGGRFLWFNLGVRETERTREGRLADAEQRERNGA